MSASNGEPVTAWVLAGAAASLAATQALAGLLNGGRLLSALVLDGRRNGHGEDGARGRPPMAPQWRFAMPRVRYNRLPARGAVSLFDLQTSQEPYGLHAVLSGEIDLSTVEAVESGLREAIQNGASVIAVDLREVSFLDSSGLRLLLQLHKDLGGSGRRLVVVQGPRRVARVFELTGAGEQLEIVADPAEIAA